MPASVTRLIRGHFTKPELSPDIAKKYRKQRASNVLALNLTKMVVSCFCIYCDKVFQFSVVLQIAAALQQYPLSVGPGQFRLVCRDTADTSDWCYLSPALHTGAKSI